MTLITDVICPFCGSLCDDLAVEVEDNKIIHVKNACKLGASKILGHDRIKSPMIRENGSFKEVSYEEAINKAVEILVNASRPLMYGWCSTVCEAHKKGILLAEEVGAVIDSTATVCHGPSIIGIHEKGMPGCTLGEIKNRADVVVFWGCNPVHAHPRHWSRYSVFPKGFLNKKGRKGRTIVSVDVRKTDTAAYADEFVQVDPGCDYLVLTALRAIIAGKEDVVPETVGGVSKEQLLKVANTLKSAKFGVIFGGLGITQNRGRYKNVDNVLSLVTELNAHTKYTAMAMRGHYNVTGIGQVLAWETGFPMAVDFARGIPYYNPGETAANDVLVRDEIDAAMIIAGDAGAHFPRKSVENLAKIPVIQIDPYENPTTDVADVVIPAAVAGVEVEGTAYRMDGVPLRMRKFVESEYMTDEEILTKMIARVREIRG
ncbi:MAG: formylmethanofuran dehydrogenase subunit B [Methanosarcinales archaeon]